MVSSGLSVNPSRFPSLPPSLSPLTHLPRAGPRGAGGPGDAPSLEGGKEGGKEGEREGGKLRGHTHDWRTSGWAEREGGREGAREGERERGTTQVQALVTEEEGDAEGVADVVDADDVPGLHLGGEEGREGGREGGVTSKDLKQSEMNTEHAIPSLPPSLPPYLTHLTELLPRFCRELVSAATDEEVWDQAQAAHLHEGGRGGGREGGREGVYVSNRERGVRAQEASVIMGGREGGRGRTCRMECWVGLVFCSLPTVGTMDTCRKQQFLYLGGREGGREGG